MSATRGNDILLFDAALFRWVIGDAEDNAELVEFTLKVLVVDVAIDDQFAGVLVDAAVRADLRSRSDRERIYEIGNEDTRRTRIGMGGSQLIHFEDALRIRSMYFR